MSAAESAAERCDYQLKVSRSPVPREFSWGELSGPDIDCARTEGNTSRGGWSDYPERELTEDEWVDWFQMMAIQEGVHEALEWFHVDGQLWLDPHVMMNKIEIREIIVRAWRELVELRRLNYGHDHQSRPLSP